MIRGIVSDLDGTLINTAGILAEAWAQAFKVSGILLGPDELLKNTKGLAPKDILKKYKVGETDLKKLLSIRRAEALKLIKSNPSILYPETLDFLNEVKHRKIKIAVATGMSRDLLRDVLETSGINGLLDAVVSSDDVAHGKPEPDIFIEAFNRISVNPKEGLVLGDSENDIIPGHGIGALTVFISRDGANLPSADRSVSNLMDILDLLKY